MANNQKPKPATKPAAKPAAKAPAKTGAKPAPVAPPAGPTVMLKVKDIVDRVAQATDGKKSVVKEMVEATLTELGKALHAGESLNLPSIGKIRVSKSASTEQGSRITVKVRRNTARKESSAGETEALAEAED